MSNVLTVLFLGAWIVLAVVLLVGASRARDERADLVAVGDDGGGRPGNRLP